MCHLVILFLWFLIEDMPLPSSSTLSNVAFPCVLTAVVLVMILWEHDAQLEVEEEEQRQFFADHRKRFEYNQKALFDELNASEVSARAATDSLEELRKLYEDVRQNVSDFQEVVDMSLETSRQMLRDENDAADGLVPLRGELEMCESRHNSTLNELAQVSTEMEDLEAEVEVLEKQVKELQSKVGLPSATEAEKAPHFDAPI